MMPVAICLLFICFVFVGIGFLVASFGEGYRYLGGPNGLGAMMYLRANSNVKAICDHLTVKGDRFLTDNDVTDLIKLGAEVIFTASHKADVIIVTENAIIAFGDTGSASAGTKGQIYYGDEGLTLFIDKLFVRETAKNIVGTYQTTTPAKQKSVVGSAVAGAVLAGSTGAIVGAVSALNHNSKAKDNVYTHLVYGTDVLEYYYMFSYHNANECFIIDKMYLSNEVSARNPYSEKNAIEMAFNKTK